MCMRGARGGVRSGTASSPPLRRARPCSTARPRGRASAWVNQWETCPTDHFHLCSVTAPSRIRTLSTRAQCPSPVCLRVCVCARARVCVCVCAFAFASKKKNAARCKQMRNTYQCSRSCAVLTPRSIITHGCGCQSVHQHCSRILACKKINAYTEMHASLQAIFIANHPDTMRARYLEHRNHWAEDGLALGGRSNLAPQPRQMAGCPTYFQGLWFVC